VICEKSVRSAAELWLAAQEYGLVLPVNGRDRFEREDVPPSERPAAHDDLVGMVGVALIANVIEAPEGAALLVEDEVALGRRKQPADLAPLSQLTLAARFTLVHDHTRYGLWQTAGDCLEEPVL
jgi:hypothetical protein